jgi:hypothetical protein
MTTTARALYYSPKHWQTWLKGYMQYVEDLRIRRETGEISHARFMELLWSANDINRINFDTLYRITEPGSLMINGINFDAMLDDTKRKVHKHIDNVRREENLKATIGELLIEIYFKQMDHAIDATYLGAEYRGTVGILQELYNLRNAKPIPYYKPGGLESVRGPAIVGEKGAELRVDGNKVIHEINFPLQIKPLNREWISIADQA